ncbi:class III lanthionine synthetase LanKC [Kutzneria albida]|uniref:non-specific serine/threonine protein kinase n=1 Tax=Kutzneria albida DSM 43870 TaxID=1449976 RepID=W5W736_9PSEU|nr:class III lanthionine synthetase LanKC [Kutzneria albida]AHH96983.1 serine/threonine protein kinase [Kutzneria albida DSM 43870]
MDVRYEVFCLADPLFYETPSRWDSGEPAFDSSLPPVPSGWDRVNQGTWTSMSPRAAVLPEQGWKVHVSAVPDNAWRVLGAVWEYCTDRGITFKFLSNEKLLVACNSKYAPRTGSGKFITIYPVGERELERVLTDLSLALVGEHGPHVLTDLRYEQGPLYVRYGQFTGQCTIADQGTVIPALRRPDGVLEPDERDPVFTLPDWVRLPSVLRAQLVRRGLQSADQPPYQVLRALHFSNSGGVYLARAQTSQDTVVLKEARPYAGLDGDGQDSVGRLYHERCVMRKLAGVAGVPEVFDFVTMWEHHFLVMGYVPGRTLARWLAEEYPCAKPGAGRREVSQYTERALDLLDKVEALLDAVHERGIVYGDLHPGNVIVDDGGCVSLVDFELSFPVHKPWLRTIGGAPGFVAPADRTGFDIDHYALAVLRLCVFLPMVSLLQLAPEKTRAHLSFVARRFPLPAGYADRVLAVLRGGERPQVKQAAQRGARGRTATKRTGRGAAVAEVGHEWSDRYWQAVRDSVVEAITLSATPQRRDRLFPGDVEQFAAGGTCFAYGAAGVIHALFASGGGRHPDYEQWLLEAVVREPPRRTGFYDGAHGIAHVLDELGYHEQALELADQAVPLTEQVGDHSLFAGLAGVGLALLHSGKTQSRPAHLARVLILADRLTAALEAVSISRRRRRGLLYGWTGPALFFLRLYEHTTDSVWLERAGQALLLDLDTGPRGRGYGNPGLAAGAAGIALVLDQFLLHAPDSPCASRLPALWRSCRVEFVPEAGLFSGRAGLIGALAASPSRRHDRAGKEALQHHLLLLIALHGTHYLGSLAFPGDRMLRLSMDLATGGAGVLCAIAAAEGQTDAVLPFLARTGWPHIPPQAVH